MTAVMTAAQEYSKGSSCERRDVRVISTAHFTSARTPGGVSAYCFVIFTGTVLEDPVEI